MTAVRKLGAEIERLIERERWPEARLAVRTAMRRYPNDHWLISRLALTHFEQRRYKLALRYDQRAVALQPRCPLALWGLAGSLRMVGDLERSAAIYRGLIRRGVHALAHGDCGEGLRWARSLVADCKDRLNQLRVLAG